MKDFEILHANGTVIGHLQAGNKSAATRTARKTYGPNVTVREVVQADSEPIIPAPAPEQQEPAPADSEPALPTSDDWLYGEPSHEFEPEQADEPADEPAQDPVPTDDAREQSIRNMVAEVVAKSNPAETAQQAEDRRKAERRKQEQEQADDTDDDEFIKSVLAQKSRASQTVSKVGHRRTDGKYVGEVRNPKSGVSKAIWDLLDSMLADDPELTLVRGDMIAIGETMGWHIGTIACQYRWWRMARGKDIRPTNAAPVPTSNPTSDESVPAPTSIDDVNVTEV